MTLEHDLLQLARDAMRSLMNGREFGTGQTGYYLNIIRRIEDELNRPQPEQEPEQAEALRLANWLETKIPPDDKTTFADVAKKLRQQHEEIKCEEKRFNDLWDKYAALVNKQYPESKFDDPRVQVVYEILCADEAPPKGEHWEGFIARRIVDALAKPEQTYDHESDAMSVLADVNADLIQDAKPEPVNRSWLSKGNPANAPVRNSGAPPKPEQEPVRWFQQFGDAPPRKPWVGLTEDEVFSCFAMPNMFALAHAVEIKLKDKNT